jgi:hypothetical protein
VAKAAISLYVQYFKYSLRDVKQVYKATRYLIKMSRVQSTKNIVPPAPPALKLESTQSTAAAAVSEGVTQETPSMQKFTRRVVCTADFTAAEIAKGVTVPFTASAAKIFTPNTDAVYDLSKGIISEISVNAISSDYDRPVHVSANLFNGRLVDAEGAYADPAKIDNSCGWLYTPSCDDFGSTASSGSRGFTNLVTILPREQTRATQVLYSPENIANSRFIAQYGGYSANNLRDGIVTFSGKDYVYVPADHVVMNVISSNWDALGVSTDLETKRESEYFKLDAGIVDDVVSQLRTEVLANMPFSDFNKLQLQYKSSMSPHAEASDKFSVCAEYKVSYAFPKVVARA